MKERINSYISSVLEESALIKAGGAIFAAEFLGSLFLFAANIILSKQFGPEGFGNFKTVLSLFLFFPALIDFGAGATLVKYIAAGNISIIKWLLKMQIASYAVFGAVILIFSKDITGFFLKNESLSYLAIPGLVVFLLTFFDIFKSIVQGFQNFRLFGLSQFLTLFFQGSLILVLGYYFGVYYALIGWGLGYLFGNILNMKYLLGKKLDSKPADIGKIFRKFSLPVYLTIFPGFIGSAVIPILSLFFSQETIGYYAFAFVFYTGILMIPAALSSVIFPKVSELHGAKDFLKARTILIKILAVYTPVVLAAIAGVILFSDSFISAVAPGYLQGASIFKTLTIFGVLSGYVQIYRSYLMAAGRIRDMTIWTLASNLLLLSISFIVLFIKIA